MEKAAKAPLAPVTEERASDYHIEGKNDICGYQVSASAVRGIDQHMCEKGREYIVFTRYKLRPLPIQEAEPGPMFTPEEGPEFGGD